MTSVNSRSDATAFGSLGKQQKTLTTEEFDSLIPWLRRSKLFVKGKYLTDKYCSLAVEDPRTSDARLVVLVALDDVLKDVLENSHIIHCNPETVILRQGQESNWYRLRIRITGWF